MAKKTDKQEARIRIKIRAYDSRILDKASRQIADTIERYGGKPVGPVPLPTETSKFTVNRASFIDKHSREQFEMRVHKRLIDIYSPTPKILESLTNLALPAGIDIELKG